MSSRAVPRARIPIQVVSKFILQALGYCSFGKKHVDYHITGGLIFVFCLNVIFNVKWTFFKRSDYSSATGDKVGYCTRVSAGVPGIIGVCLPTMRPAVRAQKVQSRARRQCDGWHTKPSVSLWHWNSLLGVLGNHGRLFLAARFT